MTESDYSSELHHKTAVQKLKNRKRLDELEAHIRKNRIVPVPLPGDTRTALGILTRERRSERYKAMIHTDSLTGLSNKRFFESLLPLELSRVKRGQSLAVMAGDLQSLKLINDTHGHDTGDRAIQAAGEGMKQSIRDTDTAAHISGDEFAALLPDVSPQHHGKESRYATQKEAASAVALRMNQKINKQAANLPDKKTSINVHMDIGITIAQSDDTPDIILKRADEAMYAMKRLNKATGNTHAASIAIATQENGQTVFDRAWFGDDGHAIQFQRLPSV